MSAYRRAWRERLSSSVGSEAPTPTHTTLTTRSTPSSRPIPLALADLIRDARQEMATYGEEAPSWDEDAIEEAYAQAIDLMESVPEAAAALYAKAQAAEEAFHTRPHTQEGREEEEEEEDLPVMEMEEDAHAVTPPPPPPSSLPTRHEPEPYDPMRICAQLAERFHFADSDLQAMHFPRVFAYYREAVRMSEESDARMKAQQEEAERRMKRGGYAGGRRGEPDAEALRALREAAPTPRTYTGPVVPISSAPSYTSSRAPRAPRAP